MGRIAAPPHAASARTQAQVNVKRPKPTGMVCCAARPQHSPAAASAIHQPQPAEAPPAATAAEVEQIRHAHQRQLSALMGRITRLEVQAEAVNAGSNARSATTEPLPPPQAQQLGSEDAPPHAHAVMPAALDAAQGEVTAAKPAAKPGQQPPSDHPFSKFTGGFEGSFADTTTFFGGLEMLLGVSARHCKSRRRDCDFADTPSPCLLNHLLLIDVEGGAAE